MTLLLNWRVWAALILAGVLAFTHLTAYRSGKNAVQVKWDAANVLTEQAAQKQAESNRELQRAAEKRYVVTTQGQDHFFTTTLTEIRHDAAPLASCPLPEPVRVRLNAAAACARGDSPASCGADAEVPSAR